MGGWSEEREISLKTGQAILKTLRDLKLNAVGIDVHRSLAKELNRLKIGYCFIALHGRCGEDGTVQGLLEMMRIPYSGSKVLASALAMDKEKSKIIFEAYKIPTAPYQIFSKEDKKIKLSLSAPVVVKPVDSGSAIGVTLVKNRSQFGGALKDAFKYSKRALVEKFIAGIEVTAPVLGEKVLPLIEIVPKGTFYDFSSKYQKGGSAHIIPARLPEKTKKLIADYALAAHKALGCQGCSRIDFMVDKKGKPWILELNSIPGMTETSLFPEAAAAAGIRFAPLLLEIIKYSE